MQKLNYVSGFLFDQSRELVALILKKKPAWQKGRLGGIGGKIEPGETALEAMRREFLEEAGVDVQDWTPFCTLRFSGGSVDFFRAVGDLTLLYSPTEEQVDVYPVEYLSSYALVDSVEWLVPMALDKSGVVAVVFTQSYLEESEAEEQRVKDEQQRKRSGQGF